MNCCSVKWKWNLCASWALAISALRRSLNLTLLVHVQYRRSFRRIQVQSHSVPHFLLKPWIVGKFKLVDTVSLYIVALPDLVTMVRETRRWLAIGLIGNSFVGPRGATTSCQAFKLDLLVCA